MIYDLRFRGFLTANLRGLTLMGECRALVGLGARGLKPTTRQGFFSFSLYAGGLK